MDVLLCIFLTVVFLQFSHLGPVAYIITVSGEGKIVFSSILVSAKPVDCYPWLLSALTAAVLYILSNSSTISLACRSFLTMRQ